MNTTKFQRIKNPDDEIIGLAKVLVITTTMANVEESLGDAIRPPSK